MRVLYAGQITPDRGLLTAVEALAGLESDVRSRLTLSVAGDGPVDYVRRVREKVHACGLDDRVVFLGKVPYEEMPMVFRRHDVLVFPSMREEGLPLTMVEAMLAGCAVVTTGSGGAEEIARLAELPRFAKNDHVALGEILAHLADTPSELSAIAQRGQQVALREFDFARMLDRWTATIERVWREGVPRNPPANAVHADGSRRREGHPLGADREPTG
jgi:glycosyltransferase involved in cell wall biosynthesis